MQIILNKSDTDFNKYLQKKKEYKKETENKTVPWNSVSSRFSERVDKVKPGKSRYKILNDKLMRYNYPPLPMYSTAQENFNFSTHPGV